MNAHHEASWVGVDPQPAPDTPSQSIGLLDGVGFLVLMTIAGWGIGRILGDEFHLLPTLAGRTEISDDDAQALVDSALDSLESGTPIDDMSALITAVNGPTRASHAFGASRIKRLLNVLDRPASTFDPRQRKHLENTYGLLAHLAKISKAPGRIELLAAMVRLLPKHPRLSAYMILVAKTYPNTWNDVSHAIEKEATDDSVISRIVDEQAPRGEQFVAAADDHYMTDMVRFKRLCEDRSHGMGSIVDGELKAMVAHELNFLDLSGEVTKRFQWLPTEAGAIQDLIDAGPLDILLEASLEGVPEAHSLLAQLVLVWTAHDTRPEDVETVVDGLGEAATHHGAAADGLIGIFKGTDLIQSLSSAQSQLRDLVHATLIDASKTNYEVVTRMATQHVPGNLAGAQARAEHADPLRRANLESVDEHDVATTISQEGLGL